MPTTDDDARRCSSTCARCGRIMHRRAEDTCQLGHHRHKGRGLCEPCYDFTTVRRNPTARDRLLQAWEDLASAGVRFDEFPRHVGKTYQAWERAFQRARRAGHPLARRYDKENV